MVLLRYGLFVLLTSTASLLLMAPFRTVALLAGLGLLVLAGMEILPAAPTNHAFWPAVAALALLALFEKPVLASLKRWGRAKHQPNAQPPGDQGLLERARQHPQAKAAIVFMSGDELGAGKLTPDLLMSRWTLLRDQLGSHTLPLIRAFTRGADDESLRTLWTRLHELEVQHAVSLWHPAQLVVSPDDTPQDPRWQGLHLKVANEPERRELLAAWHARRWVVTMMSTAGHSQDTAINLVDMAVQLNSHGLAGQTAFYLIQNKYDNRDDNRPTQQRYDTGELQQREKLCQLIETLSPGTRAYNVQNWTPFGFKAGGMTGMDLVPEENLGLTTLVVLDRNATVHDLDAFVLDLAEAMTDPNLAIVIPGRGTTNTLTDIGQGSQLIEEGHRSFLRGLMGLLGGDAGESLGTGWGNIVSYTYGKTQRAMLDPAIPKMPLTSRMHRGSSFQMRTEGLIGFGPHAVGISEDTWAVSQATHNLVATGATVRFRLSRAFWHKLRETWSHAEWLTSFPRWSGGYLQMMHDGLMQRINDFGPLPLFARELRAFSGRAYLTAPLALFNILFLPLAILLDATPFVQILIVLWNLGFVMNQVLTLHGLNVFLEGHGFSRLGALLGAATAASGAQALHPGSPYTAGLILVGLFVGGFWTGLSRWAYTRLRDTLMFGPQLILHGLGQWMRQTIEFTISGAASTDPQRVNMAYRALAGPREDQPLSPYPHFINLRTVVWYIGVPSVLLNLMALSHLDMFNVLLLLPSLMFCVSLVAGPFIMTPRPGLARQLPVRLTKWLAWPAALVGYLLVSMLIAGPGFAPLLGLGAGACIVAALLSAPLRHVHHRARLRSFSRSLARDLDRLGVSPPEATVLANELLAQSRDPRRIETALGKLHTTPEQRQALASWLVHHVGPSLAAPSRAPRPRSPALGRAIVEFRRTLAVASLTLLWFFVVPVPGLLVFTAGSYRLSTTLAGIMLGGLSLIALTLIGHWTAEALLARRHLAKGPRSLQKRAQLAFARIQAAWDPTSGIEPAQTARRAALLTDFQTFLDQRSIGYATQCLKRIEQLDDTLPSAAQSSGRRKRPHS
jgi:hypothetical protein